jgi:hypothetical protein
MVSACDVGVLIFLRRVGPSKVIRVAGGKPARIEL